MAMTLISLGSCKAGSGGAGAAQPKPQPMPPNAEWQGVYQGPYHIQLLITTKGNRASESVLSRLGFVFVKDMGSYNRYRLTFE